MSVEHLAPGADRVEVKVPHGLTEGLVRRIRLVGIHRR